MPPESAADARRGAVGEAAERFQRKRVAEVGFHQFLHRPPHFFVPFHPGFGHGGFGKNQRPVDRQAETGEQKLEDLRLFLHFSRLIKNEGVRTASGIEPDRLRAVRTESGMVGGEVGDQIASRGAVGTGSAQAAGRQPQPLSGLKRDVDAVRLVDHRAFEYQVELVAFLVMPRERIGFGESGNVEMIQPHRIVSWKIHSAPPFEKQNAEKANPAPFPPVLPSRISCVEAGGGSGKRRAGFLRLRRRAPEPSSPHAARWHDSGRRQSRLRSRNSWSAPGRGTWRSCAVRRFPVYVSRSGCR
ncbi:hypothetical protein SDC9_155732 [bioreactor metagenome]|uniref:Uncharacterized protein n=1 Tax=bioreactor metagenome TaxID=1076179 RepID=A0A645F3M7_9ZZZZ